jgi:hypothetical protein
VQGKGYELASGEGQRIWMECVARASRYGTPLTRPQPGAAGTLSRGERGDSDRVAWERGDIDQIADAPIPGGYGEPITITPRLGQRSFRIAVLDTYARRCAVTNERTLPALEAAHIRDYSDVHQHEITNGILFRADEGQAGVPVLQRASAPGSPPVLRGILRRASLPRCA